MRCTATLRQSAVRRAPSTSAAAQPRSGADAPPVAVLSLPVISYACFARLAWAHQLERPSCSPQTRRDSGVQKREAPAVAGPGLSCRGVTTILADRDVAT